jgi:hypothetical protein
MQTEVSTDLVRKLNGMKKATVSCVKELMDKAEDYAYEGKLEKMLKLANYILDVVSTISDDVEEFLSKEGSPLWEEKERRCLHQFRVLVRQSLAQLALIAIQIKLGKAINAEA